MNASAPQSRRLRLRLEYDGALFCGWQLQSDEHESRKTSVQGEMERALGTCLRAKERVVVQGCGRTDAGVSARDFYMHFDVPETSPFPEGLEAREKFRHSLNGILPEGVAVLRVDAVKADFHALYDVKWKTYEYSLLVRRAKATVDASTHHWIPEFPARFRMDAVLEALKLFEGSHDFVAFAASNHTAQTTVRKIDRAEARLAPVVPGDDENEGLFVVFRFTGKGFLKQMVRTLAGTLVEVGLGKRDVESVKRLLTGRVSRTESGFCAPAHALRLAKVSYDEARET